jgi:putative ABC transport system permease protein
MTANVVREIMRRGMGIVLLGTALGIAGATLLGGALERQLFAVTPTDPVSLMGTALVVMGIGALASYVPARRAARVDPMVALRIE